MRRELLAGSVFAWAILHVSTDGTDPAPSDSFCSTKIKTDGIAPEGAQ
jgi:hypothetical protein